MFEVKYLVLMDQSSLSYKKLLLNAFDKTLLVGLQCCNTKDYGFYGF